MHGSADDTSAPLPGQHEISSTPACSRMTVAKNNLEDAESLILGMYIEKFGNILVSFGVDMEGLPQ